MQTTAITIESTNINRKNKEVLIKWNTNENRLRSLFAWVKCSLIFFFLLVDHRQRWFKGSLLHICTMVYDKVEKKNNIFAINVFSCVADRKRIRRHKQNKSKVSRKLMNGVNKRRGILPVWLEEPGLINPTQVIYGLPLSTIEARFAWAHPWLSEWYPFELSKVPRWNLVLQSYGAFSITLQLFQLKLRNFSHI